MFARWIERKGPQMDETSKKMSRLLLEQYGDVPIPTGRETLSRTEVKELEKTHYIVDLSGKSLRDLKREDDGIAVWTSSSLTPADLDAPSRVGDVALPKELFLPDSGYKFPAEQKAMVETHAVQTQKRPGLSNVTEIIGQAADYVGAVREVKRKYKKELYSKEYDYKYTLALVPSGSAIVGYLNDGEVDVHDWRPDDRRDYVLVSPLVVPT